VVIYGETVKVKIALIVFLITILLVSYIALIYWRQLKPPEKPRKIRIDPAPATRTPEFYDRLKTYAAENTSPRSSYPIVRDYYV